MIGRSSEIGAPNRRAMIASRYFTRVSLTDLTGEADI
jgi:hypothetical protein